MKERRNSRAVVVYSASQGTLVGSFGRLNMLFLETISDTCYLLPGIARSVLLMLTQRLSNHARTVLKSFEAVRCRNQLVMTYGHLLIGICYCDDRRRQHLAMHVQPCSVVLSDSTRPTLHQQTASRIDFRIREQCR